MSSGVKEDKAAARGMYYYRGRYWSTLTWSRLNRPEDSADASLPVEEGGNSAAESEAAPRGDPRRAPEPLTTAGR